MNSEYALEKITYVVTCSDEDELEYLIDNGFHVIHIGTNVRLVYGEAEKYALYSLGWYEDKARGVEINSHRPHFV